MKNESMPLSIMSRNVGLVIKQRAFIDTRQTSDDTKNLIFSLLDCYDGFNMSYTVNDFFGPSSSTFSLSENTLDRYLMETFNSDQAVIYSFQHL